MRLPSASVVSWLMTKSPLRGVPVMVLPSPNSPAIMPPPGPCPPIIMSCGGGGGGGVACPIATVAVRTAIAITAIEVRIKNFMEFISPTSCPWSCISLVHNSHGAHQAVIPDHHVRHHRLTAAVGGARCVSGKFHANNLLVPGANQGIAQHHRDKSLPIDGSRAGLVSGGLRPFRAGNCARGRRGVGRL